MQRDAHYYADRSSIPPLRLARLEQIGNCRHAPMLLRAHMCAHPIAHMCALRRKAFPFKGTPIKGLRSFEERDRRHEVVDRKSAKMLLVLLEIEIPKNGSSVHDCCNRSSSKRCRPASGRANVGIPTKFSKPPVGPIPEDVWMRCTACAGNLFISFDYPFAEQRCGISDFIGCAGAHDILRSSLGW